MSKTRDIPPSLDDSKEMELVVPRDPLFRNGKEADAFFRSLEKSELRQEVQDLLEDYMEGLLKGGAKEALKGLQDKKSVRLFQYLDVLSQELLARKFKEIAKDKGSREAKALEKLKQKEPELFQKVEKRSLTDREFGDLVDRFELRPQLGEAVVHTIEEAARSNKEVGSKVMMLLSDIQEQQEKARTKGGLDALREEVE